MIPGLRLASHPGLDGIFFTGSFAAGRSLSLAVAEIPGKILALEMGGNNPLVIWNAKDHAAVAYFTILSAFITAGQRCSCARRLIVPAGTEGDGYLEALLSAVRKLRIGVPSDRPEPFMGTVISNAAADHILAAHDDLLGRGGIGLLAMQRQAASSATTLPGIIDVTPVHDCADVEIFGPLLQVIRVPDWEAAIREANNTAYGLCAGLLSDDPELYGRFYESARWPDQLEPPHYRREQRRPSAGSATAATIAPAAPGRRITAHIPWHRLSARRSMHQRNDCRE